jgi:transcription initiation factor TFIID subunit 5
MANLPKMYYGIAKDDLALTLASDKKRLKSKDAKDKKKDATAPVADRIPMPALPEATLQERRNVQKESQKKTKISLDNPPSVCLYSVVNANEGVCSASISENCSMVALGYGNSVIQVHALADEYLKVLKPASDLEQYDNDYEEFFDGMYDESQKLKQIDLIGHQGPVYSVSFSCERRLLLSSSRDATTRLWSLDMRKNLVTYKLTTPVWQAQFCSRGYYFATSSADHCVHLWATDRTQPLRVFADATNDVMCLDFHPNCNYIVGGSDDHVIRVWDVLSGTAVRTLTGHKGPVRGVKVSPDGRYLASAGAEGTIALWDLAQQKLLCTQECPPMDCPVPIVFSRDGSVFAAGTPFYGVSFFHAEGVSGLNPSTHDPTSEPKVNPANFTLFSYATKRTALLDLHFSKKNVVVAVGAFDQ